jgi:hypothetical protein
VLLRDHRIFSSPEHGQLDNALARHRYEDTVMRVNPIKLSGCLLSAALLGSVAIAMAQDEPPPGSMPSRAQHTIKNDDMVNMRGMHTMSATVTQTDPNTGVVDVMAGGMALRVHFPPSSMVNLKAGDKIGLYMGYRQASVVK